MTKPALHQESAREPSQLFRNRAFLQLWVAQGLSQTATNAMIYALMVLIESSTGSSVYMSLLVLSTIVPSVVFGLGAGVFVDRWPKRSVLWITNALRAATVLAFIPASFAHPESSLAWLLPGTPLHDAVVAISTTFYHSVGLHLALVYGVNIAFSTIAQFFAPAEVAMIPGLVRRKQLIEANGLFNLTFTGSQLAGFVFVGPGLVKSFGIGAMFAAMAVCFAAAAVLTRALPDREPLRVVAQKDRDLFSGVMDELQQGWAVLTQDKVIFIAIINLTIANALMLITGALAPGYVNRVLGIPPEDAVVILAPAGVGILVGIMLLRYLVVRLSVDALAYWGLLLTALVLYGLGGLGNFGPGLAERGAAMLASISRSELPILVGMVMLLAFVLGIAYAMINVPAQTTLQERTPEDKRGRVFATQFTFANVVSIIPLLFLSGLADLLGITNVVLITATIILGTAYYARRRMQVGAPYAANQDS
ncbi:MAG: MFS transporter [Chloroflexi bacterium]|nr:MFS transporter [Chloroflexota bacterium]